MGLDCGIPPSNDQYSILVSNTSQRVGQRCIGLNVTVKTVSRQSGCFGYQSRSIFPDRYTTDFERAPFTGVSNVVHCLLFQQSFVESRITTFAALTFIMELPGKLLQTA